MRRFTCMGVSIVVAVGLAAGPASAGARDDIVSFQTPSKNIACSIISSEARCDIAKRSWHATKKPASCPLDWGNGLEVGLHRKANFTCAGDTILHTGRVLPVGKSVSQDSYRCTVTTKGVKCLNVIDGHGFNLTKLHARRF